MINDELFVRVLAKIESEPEHWSQVSWRTEGSCGTSYCFAGWAIQLTDPKLWQEYLGYGGARSAGEIAAEALGESVYELALGDRHLFDGGNTLDDLYRITSHLLGIDEAVLRDKVRGCGA